MHPLISGHSLSQWIAWVLLIVLDRIPFICAHRLLQWTRLLWFSALFHSFFEMGMEHVECRGDRSLKHYYHTESLSHWNAFHLNALKCMHSKGKEKNTVLHIRPMLGLQSHFNPINMMIKEKWAYSKCNLLHWHLSRPNNMHSFRLLFSLYWNCFEFNMYSVCRSIQNASTQHSLE